MIRLSSIGDILLTTPIIRGLKVAFPQAELHFLTKPSFDSILEGNPALSAQFTTENFKPTEPYDLIVDLQHHLNTRKYHRYAKRVLVYEKENWKKWALVQFKLNFYKRYQSVVERYARPLKSIGVELDEKGCEMFLSESEIAFGAKHREASPVLAVCFGARHFTKRFPPTRFAKAINGLLERNAVEVWLLGSKADSPLADEIMKEVQTKGRVKNFSGQHTLRETAAMLATADAALTNDTGLMHLASAFQKPIVALFGSSVKEFGFLPYQTPNAVLEVENLNCRPCSHIGREECPKGHFKCMNEISEARIIEGVEAFLPNAKKR